MYLICLKTPLESRDFKRGHGVRNRHGRKKGPSLRIREPLALLFVFVDTTKII